MPGAVSYLVFPEDVGTAQQGHFMTIQAFPQELTTQYAQSSSRTFSTVSGYSDVVTLFIPGGGESLVTFQMDHQYDDVRMTRIPNAIVGAAAAAGRINGTAINPKVEVLFGHTNLRSFQFNYNMAPSSPQEARNMVNIIKTLRMHSSPVLVGESDPRADYGSLSEQFSSGGYLRTGGLFLSPSEFEIRFYNAETGDESSTIPKIGRCVLEKVNVTYCRDGEYSTFSDGTPTSAYLELNFREMRIIDAKNVVDGY